MNPLGACRLCSHGEVAVAFELQGVPRFNHRLLRPDELKTDSGITLTVLCCPACGFVSVPAKLDEDYYADYVNVPSLSLQARDFQAQQAREFVEQFELWGRTVLEVGCGDGYFLDALQRAGAVGVGLEPSNAQRAIARGRGLNVEEGILAGGRRLPQAPFSAFVTRQVFEHVEDMHDFLLTIRDNLADGAVGLVEVPHLEKLAAEARFFDFIPEHLNYFTRRTLALALQLAGFEVLEVVSVQDGEALRALARWRALPTYESLEGRVESLRNDLRRFVAACKSKGQKVAFWGAGGKGLSMLAIAETSEVDLLVDADQSKHGLYTPVSHLEVRSPESLAEQGIGAVVVLAPAYEREIAAQLRSKWRFEGEIILAGSSFLSFP